MSEEILKALMQLFAIIAKQDDGISNIERTFVVNFLKQQLSKETVDEYLILFEKYLDSGKKKTGKLTSVRDSVKTLGIARKINRTLTQKQKVIVLIRLFEFINTEKKITSQRLAIINTVAEVFNIPIDEINSIRQFILSPKDIDPLTNDKFLIISSSKTYDKSDRFIYGETDEPIYCLRIPSVEIYFLLYNGKEELYLNGLSIYPGKVFLFANGSSLKLPKGYPIFYSDVVARFMSEKDSQKVVYEVKNVSYTFPTGDVGLHPISFTETQGKLVGIMGASGSGKTTLLNVLAGNYIPTQGQVFINDVNFHTEKDDKLKGIIGLVPQDDLLVEELSVFQNLYFNAKLCFKGKTDEEIKDIVNKQLEDLNLSEIKHLKVGSPFNKFISGGQRKRLNIALELIREPAILFLDEPTSGLSSRDSENVMNLLRQLSLRGKLVFVVIHQPSSDIFKMFDNVLIMDEGGYMVYYGNPVESVIYFKTADNQINNQIGECPVCGNVNPELLFNIIDAKVVDEYGNYTKKRKVNAEEWATHFEKNRETKKFKKEHSKIKKTLNIPSWFSQLKVFFLRDILAKFANRQYMMLNLIEAPLLAFILSVTIFYISDPSTGKYIFRENENIPIYIFMSIIVALFLGMTISADEIFKDRKILLREKFLNLSWSGYLVSKVSILFTFSAIQSVLFIVIGNTILGLKGMYFEYWLALFTMSAFANIVGLIISASFNSVVTIYILIPLVMIPQMMLGGAMFSFDKLNRWLTRPDKVPIIADMMATRWIYEALVVTQFKDNDFEKPFFDIEQKESYYNFKQVYYLPKLKDKLSFISEKFLSKDSKVKREVKNDIELFQHELRLLRADTLLPIRCYGYKQWQSGKIDFDLINQTNEYIDKLSDFVSMKFLGVTNQKEKLLQYILNTQKDLYYSKKDDYYNESIADIVQKVFEKNKIIQYKNRLVQQVDPVYQNPIVEGYFDYRAHFYAPKKHFMGKFFDTFNFNIVVVWLMTIFLFFALYLNWLKKILNLKLFFFKKR